MKTRALSLLVILSAIFSTTAWSQEVSPRTSTEHSSPSAAGIRRTSWTPLGPTGTGSPVRALAIDPLNPLRIFAGSAGGGLWRSEDGGATWAPVDDFLASLDVTCLLFKPVNPTTLYAGTGESGRPGSGILSSTDGGTSWAPLPSTLNAYFSAVNRLAMAPNESVFLAATGTGLYRSIDSGATWSLVVPPANFLSELLDVRFLPGSSAFVVASERQGKAYYSVDGGATWVAAMVPAAGYHQFFGDVWIGTSPSSPSTVYILVNKSLYIPPYLAWTLEVWKSTDGGASYATVSSGQLEGGGTHAHGAAIWVDPTDANVLVVGANEMSRSTTGGTSWTTISDGNMTRSQYVFGPHAIVSDPGYDGSQNRRVYFGGEEGVYKTEDVRTVTVGVGGGYVALNTGLATGAFVSGSGDPATGLILASAAEGTYRTAMPGGLDPWTRVPPIDAGPTAIDPTDPQYLYAARSPHPDFDNITWLRINRTRNGGATWEELTIGGSADIWTPAVTPFVLDPNDPNRMLAGNATLRRTNDIRTPTSGGTGPTWTTIKSRSTSIAISAISVQPGNSDAIWVGYDNGDVWVTSDGTAVTPAWLRVDLAGLPDRKVTRIVAGSEAVYVAFDGTASNNLWKTTNGGASWISASGSGAAALPAVPVRSVAVHPKNASFVYAGTDAGVFASTDGGATWGAESDGPANTSVTDLFWMHTDLVAVTNGRGMFRTRTTDVLMTLDDPIQDQTLSQPLLVRGWAFDRTAATGTGVDAIHVYAYPQTGAPIFLGIAPGVLRPDVGAVFGDRYTASGFELEVRGLVPGTYTIVAHARSTVSEAFEAARAATITIAAPVSRPLAAIDAPAAGTTVGASFYVAGWALDLGEADGPGVDAIHVYAFPAGGGAPTFLGVATYGLSRPDVGAAFGSRFTNAGYALAVTATLAPGEYQLVVYYRSTVSGAFSWIVRPITAVGGSPLMAVDTPSDGATVTRPFLLAGWAIDRDPQGSGTGVDAIHAWAFASGGGAPIFLGVAAYGMTRSDVGAVFGSRFTNSGYNLGTTLAAGTYQIVVYAHSTVTGTFNQWRVVRVTVGGP